MNIPVDRNDRKLLDIQVNTRFVLTEHGRIACENDPERSQAPRLFIAGCQSGNVYRIGHEVGDDTARAIENLIADEPPLGYPDGEPVHLDDYVALLSVETPMAQKIAGLNYSIDRPLTYEHDVSLVKSDTPAGDRFVAGLVADQTMPESLVKLGFHSVADMWTPWCFVIHEGEAVSVCITARNGAEGAEAGVATVPELRGRGFAAAATAGWASLPALQDRKLFYGHLLDNHSSRRVAERLGLRAFSATFSLI
jgi:hypothetical protein